MFMHLSFSGRSAPIGFFFSWGDAVLGHYVIVRKFCKNLISITTRVAKVGRVAARATLPLPEGCYMASSDIREEMR